MPRQKAVTKKQIIKEMAEETGSTQKSLEATIDLFFEKVTEALGEGEAVRIHHFGTFKTKKRDSYVGRNPKTGESMTVAAKKVIRFAPSEALKNAL